MKGSSIIGLSAHHPDASAAAVRDGIFVAGVEEERFRRVKHWAGFPEQALKWCASELAEAGGGAIDAIAVARQPRAYLTRKLALALANPRSLARAIGRARNLGQVATLAGPVAAGLGLETAPPVIAVEHHRAHLASAFFCSPFEEAACLSIDGFGDFVSTMLGRGRGNVIDVMDRVHFPHSLGLFYQALTQYLGFWSYGDEYKVMGLAAYGEPRFVREIRALVPGAGEGSFRLDLRYFCHLSDGVEMVWKNGKPHVGRLFTRRLEDLLGPARDADDELGQRHMDIAASMQAVYEERFFALVRRALSLSGSRNLALAGGCALNSLANGKLFDHTDVEGVFIQAAAGDAGTALGAALHVHYQVMGHQRSGWIMEHSAWGPEYADQDIQRALVEALPVSNGEDGRFGEFEIRTHRDDESLCRETAQAIAGGEVVGWYQGRAEWGPRALGHRSILADPRRADMKDVLNIKIKRRESFRPFAPSVLEEHVGEWFEHSYPDPFMMKVYPIREAKRAAVPAVTHADGTGRLQTVSERNDPLYHALISAFRESTGVPMLLNTSFNENEPIVNEPREAIECFLRTRMDRIVLDRRTVRRGRDAKQGSVPGGQASGT